MNITRSTRILGTTIALLGVVACNEGTPFEPAVDGTSAAVSDPVGTLGTVSDDLTLPDPLDLVLEVVDTLEVDEVIVTNPLAGLPVVPLLSVSSSGLAPSFSTSSDNENSGWTSTTANQTNPCTGEDIQFDYRTRVISRYKEYRDGTVRVETRITSKGKGVVTPPQPTAGTRYQGFEDDFTRSYVGPKRTEDYQDQRTTYVREGNELEDDDFYFHRRLRIVYNPDGSIAQVKTDQTRFECR